MDTVQPAYRFTLYRFVGPKEERTTQVVKDLSIADGMRGLVEQDTTAIASCREKVEHWAANRGICLSTRESFPSTKHPGKVWVDFRFGALTI